LKITRRDMKPCPNKTEVKNQATGRINKMKVCGAAMHHYDDHSECPRCGFYLDGDATYDTKTRETSIVRKLK